jgi:putative phosphoesterase
VRVAALYDVHGNLAALEAVLAEVARERVDAIVCGGDLVSGPFPAEVFDRISAWDHAFFVRGNADRFAVERDTRYGGMGAWCASELGDERLALIAEWPLTVEIGMEGFGRVLFCHAVPSADEPIFTRVTPDPEVEELIGEVDADVLVCGHTHVQFDRALSSGLRVVNAGSVGMPYQGEPGAYWALLGVEIELRRTTYDVEAAAAAIRATGAPGSDQHAAWLLDPPDPDETTEYFESLRQPRDAS